VKIVAVSAGVFRYGLVVDDLLDAEEIVVKPLGRHLKGCQAYAGATIMGDGRVALILDVAGLARQACLTSLDGTDRAAEVAREQTGARTAEDIVVFRYAEDEQFALPLDAVVRMERVKAAAVEEVGGARVLQYRGGVLPLVAIDDVARVKPRAGADDLVVLVLGVAGHSVGLIATPPVDTVEAPPDFDPSLAQPGIRGAAVVAGKPTLLVDAEALVKAVHPLWF
jgi:two-component system chemotaxis sensor kinase CheA